MKQLSTQHMCYKIFNTYMGTLKLLCLVHLNIFNELHKGYFDYGPNTRVRVTRLEFPAMTLCKSHNLSKCIY